MIKKRKRSNEKTNEGKIMKEGKKEGKEKNISEFEMKSEK